MMLVLTRKPREKILISDSIAISILDVQGRQVRIGVEAPRHLSILRDELANKTPEKRSISGPRRLLIVDDSPEDRYSYQRLLCQDVKGQPPSSQAPARDDVLDYRPFRFNEASTGSEGLRLCRAEVPDCVLLDYCLPDLNGLEFLEAMRDDRLLKQVPVIMLTGQGAESVAVKAMKRGASDYLVKSELTRELLCRTVSEVLSLA